MFDSQMLSNFHFLRPWWLLGLLPFVLLFLLQLRQRDTVSAWRKVIAPHLLPLLIVQQKNTKKFGPLQTMMLAAVLLFVALAGPSWDKKSSPLSQDNAVLIIALDVSESMDQSDISPSRLQRAKQKIVDLLSLRGDSYTGLIAYAGSAHTVIPLSNDGNVMRHFLDAIKTSMMPREGKMVEKIIPLTQSLLQGVATPATILIISDGATELSIAAFEEAFSQSPHQILVWGIGATQSQLDAQSVQGFDSNIIALQQPQLQQLAVVSGGYYQPMSVDKTDVKAIYRRVNNYFLLSDDDSRPWVDRGYWLVFPLMLLLALWFRRGWVIQW